VWESNDVGDKEMCRAHMLVLMLFAVTSLATAQKNTGINCHTSPERCEVTIGGQVLTWGMPKDQVLALLSKGYEISEDSQWSAAHKPDSKWYLSNKNNHFLKGGVKFKDQKLDGAMVDWSPDSSEQGDFAANLLNLLERFSKEGSRNCELITDWNTTPQQEQRWATFQCGLRAVSVELDRFQQTYKGERVEDSARIYELFGNW
jgi:hypothetical protein